MTYEGLRPGDTVEWTDEHGRTRSGILQHVGVDDICVVKVWPDDDKPEGEYTVECSKLKRTRHGTV